MPSRSPSRCRACGLANMHRRVRPAAQCPPRADRVHRERHSDAIRAGSNAARSPGRSAAAAAYCGHRRSRADDLPAGTQSVYREIPATTVHDPGMRAGVNRRWRPKSYPPACRHTGSAGPEHGLVKLLKQRIGCATHCVLTYSYIAPANPRSEVFASVPGTKVRGPRYGTIPIRLSGLRAGILAIWRRCNVTGVMVVPCAHRDGVVRSFALAATSV